MIEFVAEQLSSLLYAVLAAGLGLAGFVVESAGMDTLLGGQQMLGVWEVVVGLLFLVAGAKLVRDKLVPA